MELEAWGDALKMLMPQVAGRALTSGCGQAPQEVISVT